MTLELDNIEQINQAVEIERKYQYINIRGREYTFSKFIISQLKKIYKLTKKETKWAVLIEYFEHYDISSMLARKNMVDIHKNDIKVLKSVILSLFPEYYECLDSVLSNHRCRYYNMFVMKKDIFNKYCDFLFKVLFEFERNIPYRERVCGAMGEILLNVFIKKNSNYKIYDRRIIQTEKTSIIQKIKRKYFSK